MAHKLLSAVTGVAVSAPIRIHENIDRHRVDAYFRSMGVTAISAVTVKLQGAANVDSPINGIPCIAKQTEVLDAPALAIGSTAERVANGAFNYIIKGTAYTKGAVAAGSVFSAAHKVTATKYGVILIYIDVSGNIVSKVVSSPQAYNSAAAAHAAADLLCMDADGSVLMPVDYCLVGRILINAGASDWTANTDDMTNASDLTTATFLSEVSAFTDMDSHSFSGAEITAQKAVWYVTDKGARWVRLYLSTLTGTGKVTAWYTPVMMQR